MIATRRADTFASPAQPAELRVDSSRFAIEEAAAAATIIDFCGYSIARAVRWSSTGAGAVAALQSEAALLETAEWLCALSALLHDIGFLVPS